jgi:hypothetical protein
LSDEIVVSFLWRYARCARRICVLRLYDAVSQAVGGRDSYNLVQITTFKPVQHTRDEV